MKDSVLLNLLSLACVIIIGVILGLAAIMIFGGRLNTQEPDTQVLVDENDYAKVYAPACFSKGGTYWVGMFEDEDPLDNDPRKTLVSSYCENDWALIYTPGTELDAYLVRFCSAPGLRIKAKDYQDDRYFYSERGGCTSLVTAGERALIVDAK